MEYKASPVGHRITCTLHGMKDEFFENNKKTYDVAVDSLEKDEFTILPGNKHTFDNKGFTGIYPLEQSSAFYPEKYGAVATLHTWPEKDLRSLYFSLQAPKSMEDLKRINMKLRETLDIGMEDTPVRIRGNIFEISDMIYKLPDRIINEPGYTDRVFEEVLKNNGLHASERKERGVFILLCESHLSLLFDKERGEMELDLFSCLREGHGKNAFNMIVEGLGAEFSDLYDANVIIKPDYKSPASS
jgi:S-adenosylmethionine/arginine decarboxylase-like enzyme